MNPPAPNNNQAPTTDYQTAWNELGTVYEPQITGVYNDINNLVPQQRQAQSQLDQAKANAFTNNALTANARGINFSGYAPMQNNAYTTNTYNPAVTKLNTTITNQRQTLQDKINAINQSRANDANTLVQNTIQAQQVQQQAEAAAQAAAARAQASTARSSGGGSSGGSSSGSSGSSKANNASYVQGSQGQYMFVGSNGKPINLQQYVTTTGGDVNTILGLLQNGTGYDKNIYNKIVAARPSNATAALNLLRELDTKKAYGF